MTIQSQLGQAIEKIFLDKKAQEIIKCIFSKILQITQSDSTKVSNNHNFSETQTTEGFLLKILPKIQIFRSDFADISTNIFMLFKKDISITQNDIHSITSHVKESFHYITSVTFLNGFLNINLIPEIFFETFHNIIQYKENYCYGKFLAPVSNDPINIEYVSVNPTGNLHLGHARGAIFADAVANLLVSTGHNVTKEYYINDAGAQVIALANSVYARYQKLCGIDVDMSLIQYPDESLNEIAIEIFKNDGNMWILQNNQNHQDNSQNWHEYFKNFAIDKILGWIKSDLQKIGISHDLYFSEKSLIDSNYVEQTLKNLQAKGLALYETIEEKRSEKGSESHEELLVFKSSDIDSPRPLKKSNGDWTYFASDIAYHCNKIDRGFKKMINVWGADHDNHVKTLKSAMKNIDPSAELEIMTVQMMNIIENNQSVKMSKRAGTFVLLREMIEKIGSNTLKFIILSKKPDTHFDFDIDDAMKQSTDNPVFYVNYAYARANSVMRQGKEIFTDDLNKNIQQLQSEHKDFYKNILEEEMNILKAIDECPILIRESAINRNPNRIITYLIHLSKLFHVLWSKGRENSDFRLITVKEKFENSYQVDITLRRIKLSEALAITIRTCLLTLGIIPTEEMK
jgi:arginyl-tRNA synthetase